MTSIISCDITKENPLETGGHKDEYNIIQTSLCLEAACETYDEFKLGIKRLAFMLKNGGFMVLFTVLGQTFYVINQQKWFTLCLNDVQIQEALKEAGLEVMVVKLESAPAEVLKNPIVADYKALGYFVAKKK